MRLSILKTALGVMNQINMRIRASADINTHRKQASLLPKVSISPKVYNLDFNHEFLKMKMCHIHFTSSTFVWICMLLNPVISTSIPSLSLDFDSSNADIFNSSVATSAALGDIDPAFTFMPSFQGPKLRPIPCLLNSVNVALQLALEDFEEVMFRTVYRLDTHPQVEIVVIPDEDGGSIPRKYAVWGLSIGIGTSSLLICVPY